MSDLLYVQWSSYQLWRCHLYNDITDFQEITYTLVHDKTQIYATKHVILNLFNDSMAVVFFYHLLYFIIFKCFLLSFLFLIMSMLSFNPYNNCNYISSTMFLITQLLFSITISDINIFLISFFWNP